MVGSYYVVHLIAMVINSHFQLRYLFVDLKKMGLIPK